MGTVELKNIISQYMDTADEKVLRIVKAVFESYEKEETDFYEELPETVKKLIELSREDIKQGRVRSHEDVMAEVRKRYNIAG